ncbi:MAG: methyltransferase domain-containing protein [Proteobacteria bacterium]|nr:methyltransferase domain-containing protein [Pseudomonadota bacterium]
MTDKVGKMILGYTDPFRLKTKLHIGCMNHYKPGWINIDNNSYDNCKKLDMCCDVLRGIPIESDTVAFIYHEHLLEHFTPEQSRAFLSECMRVLKPGGVMRIAVPDVMEIIRMCTNPDVFAEFKWIRDKYKYGDLTPIGALNANFRWWGHQWLYDWEELLRRFSEIGIDESKITRCEFGKSTYPDLVGIDTREGESIIAEVVK